MRTRRATANASPKPRTGQQQEAAEADAAEDFRSEIGTAALPGGGIAAVIAVALALYVGGLVSDPVSRPARAAGRFAAGDRQIDLSVTGITGLDDLRAALQQLGHDLERTERQRDRLVDDVSQELRTPLAVLRGHVEGMRDGVIEPDAATLTRPANANAANRADGVPSFDVFTVNGKEIRPAGKPPWAGGPAAVGEPHPGYAGWSRGEAARNARAGNADSAP